MPSIDVSITASSSKLDLTVPTHFIIKVELLLRHTGPITISTSDWTLFTSGILCDGGLAFVDMADGQEAKREMIDMCYLDAYFSVNKDSTHKYCTTLHPGQKIVLSGRIYPSWPERYRTIPVASGPVTEPLVWYGADGLQDGKQYEIKLSSGCRLTGYADGSIDELLELLNSMGFEGLGWKWENVPLNLVKTAQFSVSRPDKGESLR